MATAMYATSLTGGAVGALDAKSVSTLANDDICFVATGAALYVYRFNSSSTSAESSPDTIRPDDYVSSGVWEMQTIPTNIIGKVSGGEINITGNTTFQVLAVDCMSEDKETHIVIGTSTTVDIASTIASGPVHRVWAYKHNNGTYGIATDTSPTGANLPTSDWVGWKKIGFVAHESSVLIKRVQNGDFVSCIQASKNILTNNITNTFATVSHQYMIAEEMVEAIEYGCKDAATAGIVYASEDGTNTSFVVGTTITTATDTTSTAWGDTATEKGGMKSYLATRQFRSSTGTLDLLLQGYKLKR